MQTQQESSQLGSDQETTAPQAPGSLVWVMSAGMPMIVGGSSSITQVSDCVQFTSSLSIPPWLPTRM